MAGILHKSIVSMHEDIREGIEEHLKELQEQEGLADLVYTDDAQLSRINPPMIWWFREPYTPEADGVQSSKHPVPYVFICMVKSTTSREGRINAEDLMGKVYDRFMRNCNNPGVWHNIRPGQLNPAHPGYESKKIHWSAVRLQFVAKRLIGGSN